MRVTERVDYEKTIQLLKEKQDLIPPGDAQRLDIEATIQGIKSIEGNWGHALYFANNPGELESFVVRLNEMIMNQLGILPAIEKSEK